MNFKNGFVVGIICVFLAFLLYLQSDLFINFPIADDFGAIINFNLDYLNTHTLSDKLTLLFSQNNDFKLVVLKLVDLAYLTIFDNVNLGHLRVFGYFLFLSTMFFLYKLGDFRKTNILYFLPVPLLMISFAYSEINAFAMESLSHFLVIFLALATFYFLFQTKYFVLAILCLFLGVFANGNGLLLIPLGALGLLFLKKYKHLVIWILASCVFLFLFFFNYNRGESTLNGSVLSRVAHVFPIYFGGIGGLESIKLNFLIGCIGIVATLYLFFFKKTYQTHLVLSLFILFFGGTYLLISAKREYTHPSEILRGAYLVNSVMIFTTLYVLSYCIYISKWIQIKSKRASLAIASVLLICGIYQARNLTRWYGTNRFFLEDMQLQTFDMYANNTNLYLEKESHYNTPLINTISFHSAIEKGILDPSEMLHTFLANPISEVPEISVLETDQLLEITNINGQQIKENPYISISGTIQNYPVSGTYQLGICIEKNGKKDYFKIPHNKDKNAWFRFKKSSNISFNCLIDKAKYLNTEIEITVFTLEKNQIISSSDSQTIYVNGTTRIPKAEETPIVFSSKSIPTDSTYRPKLLAAYTHKQISQILVNIPAELQHNPELYLGFESTEDSPSFMLKLETDSTSPSLARCVFNQKILKKKHPLDNTYLLRLVTSGTKQTQYPMKSYFFIPAEKY
jgi:hypothetical protein